jgi:hypothetical protein
MPSDFLRLKTRTRFGLKLQLYLVAWGFLVCQAVLARLAPLDLLVSVLLVWYLVRVSQELKSRREPLTRKQKHILFGLGACAFGVILAGLLVVGLIKRTPIVWIAFGLVAVISLALLFYEHDQLYKDGEPV